MKIINLKVNWFFVFVFLLFFYNEAAAGKDKVASVGVFLHYLVTENNCKDRMASFDSAGLAYQLGLVGVDYVFITVGQNSGVNISPNSYLGSKANGALLDECSNTDLIASLLAEKIYYKFDVGLYYPLRAPQNNQAIRAALGDTLEQNRSTEVYVDNFEKIIKVWADRYGREIFAWWFDGAYNVSAWDDDFGDPWRRLTSIIKKGNPDSMIAFNAGTARPLRRFTPSQNLAAGEMRRYDLDKINSYVSEFVREYSTSDFVLHIVFPMGDSWGRAGDAVSVEELKSAYCAMYYTNGMLSLDVGVDYSGLINSEHLNKLVDFLSFVNKKSC